MKKQTAESFKQQNKGKRSAAPKLRCVDLFCGCGGMSLGFEKAGYGLTQRILDAAYCGVPQTRKRMFVVGALGRRMSSLAKNWTRRWLTSR